jgi:hypothetical protein
MPGVVRALLLVTVVAALLAGCGETRGPSRSTTTATAAAACTKPALLAALRTLGTADPLAVQNLRCGSGYALTRVREGETFATILWQDVNGTWSQVAREDPGACPEQAAARSLCTPPPPDPALRRCTTKAFLAALRADVDRLPFRVEQMRCAGGFATTRFVVSDCLPEQTTNRSACERTRVAAWRRDATRWRLITYSQTLDCNVVRDAAPRFPAALCR